MIAYNVIRLDLATARDRYPIDVPGPVLVFQAVPAPVEIRVGDSRSDAILVERPGRLSVCSGDLGRVYLSHAAAAGTLEVLVSRVLSADFPGGSSRGGAGGLLLAHVTAGDRSTGNINARLYPGGTAAPGHAGSQGIAAQTIEGIVGEDPVYGVRLAVTDSVAGYKNVSWRPVNLSIGVIAGGDLTAHGLISVSDDVAVVDTLWQKDQLDIVFGVGWGDRSAGGVHLFGPLFWCERGTGTWRAILRTNDGTTYGRTILVEDTGVPAVDEIHRLEIVYGAERGRPVVRWRIDGRDVAEVAQPGAIDLGPRPAAVHYGVHVFDESGTRNRGALLALLREGLRVVHYPPEG